MVIFTKHALNKLDRKDIKQFKINKSFIKSVVKNPDKLSKTKYGDYAAIARLDFSHEIRIIYDIIINDYKIITFHIARKGRYL